MKHKQQRRYFLITFSFTTPKTAINSFDIVGIQHGAFPTFQEQIAAIRGTGTKADKVFPICCNEVSFYDMERWRKSLTGEDEKKTKIITK